MFSRSPVSQEQPEQQEQVQPILEDEAQADSQDAEPYAYDLIYEPPIQQEETAVATQEDSGQVESEQIESVVDEAIPKQDYQQELDMQSKDVNYYNEIKSFFSYTNDNKLKAALNYLSLDRRALTENAFMRSADFFPLVKEVFEKEKLPLQVGIGLITIESAWKTKAHSRARAAGLFQFIRSTGKRYGLRRNYYQDERYHIKKAAAACARHMVNLYNLLGDWKLALAAYNAGELKIFKAMLYAGYTRDWHKLETSSYLRQETRDYVSKVIAATILWQGREKYGFAAQTPSSNSIQEIAVSRSFSPVGLARFAGWSYSEFKRYNSHFRRQDWVKPLSGTTMLVPGAHADKTRTYLAGSTRAYKQDKQRYARSQRYSGGRETYDGPTKVIRISRGMTLYDLAREYNLSVGALMRLNNLRSSRIVAGKRLKVPTDRVSGADTPQVVKSDPNYDYIRIRRGMTLYDLAKQYGTSVRSLMRINNLRTSRIIAGQMIKVPKRNRQNS